MFRKFTDWLTFNPPVALSFDDWGKFNEKFRKEAPVRYFLTNRLHPRIRRIGRKIRDAVWWVRYRTVTRYHILDTGLEPGWHDIDEKMLHVCFNMLVDYVEQECAWMLIAFDADERKKRLGWYDRIPHFLRVNKWRSREAGLEYLDWEITLEDPALGDYERNPSQARRARIAKELYLWWTETRPARELPPSPDDSIGLEFLSDSWKNENPEASAAFSDWSDDCRVLEEAWGEEDTVMLLKLVKIRRGLWT